MIKRIVGVTIIFIFLVLGGFAYYVFLTPGGAEFVSRIYLPRIGLDEGLVHNKITGNFLQGLSVKNLEIPNFKGLPKDSLIRVQEIKLFLRLFSIADSKCSIYNGRLELSTRETVQFYGSYESKKLDFNIYSKSLSLSTLAQLFPGVSQLKLAKGTVEDSEIFVLGSIRDPALKGSCNLKEAKVRNLVLKDALCSFYLKPGVFCGEPQIWGTVNISGGSLQSRSAIVKVGESKMVFNGDPQMPVFDINGQALIGETEIHILLKGTPVKPELTLASVPAFPQEKLFLMLLTGKSWESMDQAASNRRMNADAVKDFVDYFFLGGSGEKLGQKLGIESISLKYETNEKGVEVKKSITNSTCAIYGLSQTRNPQETVPLTSQKVGVEYKVTDTLSISGTREIGQSADKNAVPTAPKDEIQLKYKKNF